MKNPFKKSSIVDTLVNVGIGGAANVAMDYVFSSIDALASVESYKDYIKLAVGTVGGAMVSGASAKYLRPAFDGIATVAASEIVNGLIGSGAADDEKGGAVDPTATGYVPFIGAVRRNMGQRGYRNARMAGVPFMEA